MPGPIPTLRRARLALLSLAALGCAAAAAAAEPGEVLGLPAYPFTSRAMPADMLTSGVPQQTRIAVTEDPVRTVVRYYREALAPRGVTVLEHAFGPNAAYVGYVDLGTSLTHLVSAIGQADGRTLLVFSSMDPRPLALGAPAAPPADLPALPRAVSVVSTDGEYGGTRHRTLHYLSPGMTPEGARRALEARAVAEGWRVQVGDGQELRLERGKASCTIHVRAEVDPDTGSPAASVSMVVLEAGAEAPAREETEP